MPAQKSKQSRTSELLAQIKKLLMRQKEIISAMNARVDLKTKKISRATRLKKATAK